MDKSLPTSPLLERQRSEPASDGGERRFDSNRMRFGTGSETFYVPTVLTKTFHFLQSKPAPVLFAGLSGLTLLIGYFDYLAGTDATFTAIYLFPVGVAAWFLTPWTFWLLAAASSVLSVGGDILDGARYPSTWIPLWNLIARFAVFAFAAQLIAALAKLNRDLEIRAANRAIKLTQEIAARERLERELLQISEREQARVGHDIHDGLCQHLTGAALAAQVVSESLHAQNSPERESADKVVELIQDGIGLARDLARGLSAVEVSNNGLPVALSDFAASTSSLFNVSCRFEYPRPVPLRDLPTSVHLYRIAQEAVSNAIKHGDAKNIVVRLETRDGGLLLRVSDDGIGLPADYQERKGMGLKIMSYRAELIGGRMAFAKRHPNGTEVSCLVPVNELVS